MLKKNNNQAVIMGGGFAGLLAAVIASKYFDNVTIVEPDVGIDSDKPRQFVPQGNQPHALLQGGQNAFKEILPHFNLNSWETGTQLVNESTEADMYFLNRRCRNFKTDFNHVIVNRPRFEYAIRQEVAKIPNVKTIKGYRLKTLIPSPDGKDIASIEIERLGKDKDSQILHADLFIDATGRNTTSPIQLEQLGFGKVEIEKVMSKIAYVSRFYEFKDNAPRDWKFINIAPLAPETKHAFLFQMNEKQFIAAVGGCAGDYPEEEEGSYLDFMRRLPVSAMYDYIAEYGIPVTDIIRYEIPVTMFRRYDAMEKWPNRFVIVGDAINVINPIYGQGMSVSSMAVRELDKLFAQLTRGGENNHIPFGTFEHDFQKKIAKEIISPVWGMVSTEDLMRPQIEGKRNSDLKFELWYATEFLKNAHEDEAMMREFYEVTHLIRSPDDLMRPEFFYKVLKSWLDRKLAGNAD